MNCQDALNLLYDIIDKQASEIDTRQVQDHLKRCHHCFDLYKVEASVHEFITEKMAHTEPTPKLEVLKSRILDTLDSIDSDHKRRRWTPPFNTTAMTLAAAAFLVVTVGAALLMAGFYRHQELYAPLEKAHWNAGTELSAFQNANATSTAIDHLSRDLGYAVSTKVANYDLVGAHDEQLMGITMTHLVYEHGASHVSVFVTPSTQFQIPENLKGSLIRHNATDYFDHNCRGCRLVYHTVGKAVVVVATTDRTVDLLDFNPDSPLALNRSI